MIIYFLLGKIIDDFINKPLFFLTGNSLFLFDGTAGPYVYS